MGINRIIKDKLLYDMQLIAPSNLGVLILLSGPSIIMTHEVSLVFLLDSCFQLGSTDAL